MTWLAVRLSRCRARVGAPTTRSACMAMPCRAEGLHAPPNVTCHSPILMHACEVTFACVWCRVCGG
jgi:hypothetical protein